MKKIMMIFLLFVPMILMADSNLDMHIQMLDRQIEELTHQRDKKYDDLKQCEKTTKGFKIAGITTLVATGVGVVGNIALAEKLNQSSGGGKKGIQDSRSQQEKNDDSAKLLCELGDTDFC